LDSLVNNFGRLALANSASSPQQANMKPKWVKSPNLPRDYVNGQADTECFFTATRDIESGEEFLWAYPLDHHMNQQVVNHNLLPSKRMMPPNGSSSHPAIKAAPLRVPHPMTLPLPHQCHHFTTCIPGKCCDCNCAKCKANQVSGRRIPKPKAAE
jgi:SET domain-containing protein